MNARLVDRLVFGLEPVRRLPPGAEPARLMTDAAAAWIRENPRDADSVVKAISTVNYYTTRIEIREEVRRCLGYVLGIGVVLGCAGSLALDLLAEVVRWAVA